MGSEFALGVVRAARKGLEQALAARPGASGTRPPRTLPELAAICQALVMWNRVRVVGVLGCCLGVGCGGAEGPLSIQRLGDARYQVVVSAPKKLRVGANGALRVEIEPQGERTLSTEFASRVRVEAMAGLAGEREAIMEASRESPEKIQFVLPLRADEPGPCSLRGRVSFGVCTGDLCERIDEPFAVALSAER